MKMGTYTEVKVFHLRPGKDSGLCLMQMAKKFIQDFGKKTSTREKDG